MSETNVCGVVLPQEVARKARVVAAMEGKSRSKLMRDLLEKYLRSYSDVELELKEQKGELDDGSN